MDLQSIPDHCCPTNVVSVQKISLIVFEPFQRISTNRFLEKRTEFEIETTKYRDLSIPVVDMIAYLRNAIMEYKIVKKK